MRYGIAVVAAIALGGCGTEPGDSDTVHYWFDLQASLRDSTAERPVSAC